MNIYTLIVFLPLTGFLTAGLFGRVIGVKASEYVTSGLLLISCALSWSVFYNEILMGHGHEAHVSELLEWLTSGDLRLSWSIRIDTLTAVMLVVVTTVSALVHVYSIGYMHHDPHRQRFFAYLSLFTFAMLMLVTADNFMQMFFGWEGVGLASYLLIGFWISSPRPMLPPSRPLWSTGWGISALHWAYLRFSSSSARSISRPCSPQPAPARARPCISCTGTSIS